MTPTKRFIYKAFTKAPDRKYWNPTPRKISYVYGNKFFLEGDPFTINNLYGVDQLLPVDEHSKAALAMIPYRQREIDYLLESDSDSMPSSNMRADQFTAEYSGEDFNKLKKNPEEKEETLKKKPQFFF